MNAEDMQLVDVRHGAGFLTRSYWNSRTNMGFSHEFSDFEPFEASLPRVRASYEHRSRRFLGALSKARHVLAVWTEQPMVMDPDRSQYREALARLRKCYPQAHVDLVVFFERPGCIGTEVVDSQDGLTVVAADYRMMDGKRLNHFVDYGRFVKYLGKNFSMPDIRTDEEKRGYAEIVANMRSCRWGVGKSRPRQWLNKRAYKIYRFLERILQRRGFVHEEGPLWFTEDIHRMAEEVSK